MSRVSFRGDGQKKFFNEVISRSGYSLAQLAKECSVNVRTLRDWKRGKYFPAYEAVKKLSRKFSVSLCGIKILDDYWYIAKSSSLGGKERHRLHGLLGTVEDRRKGGAISQLKRKQNLEKYRDLGCIVRKKFKAPRRSEKLAEIMGIILGDGALTDYQVRVTLDREVDRKYAKHVQKLMQEIFGEKPSWIERIAESCILLTISGIELVENLEKLGLQRGNKVLHQVDFPTWIKEKSEYEIACVRGLFDTDGGLYFHAKGRKKYLGWCFGNASKPLIENVLRVLINLGFNAKKSGERKIYIYSLEQIQRYMDLVGSNNPKNIAKLNLRKKL